MSDIPTDPKDMSVRDKRLLVVEDEFLILLDIQSILEAAGAALVVTASRIVEALAALDRPEKFDAAVLDLKLDRDSAAPVAERLTEMKVPFVFLTGAPTEAELAIRFGSAPIIGKPFDRATLLKALSQAMATGR